MNKKGQTSIRMEDLQLPEEYKQALKEKFPETNHQERVVKTPTPDTITNVKLQSMLDAHIHYTGQVTGKSYEWVRAGSVVAVDSRDVPALLQKRIKTQSCCNQSDNAIFQSID